MNTLKQIRYAIGYGMGPKRVSEALFAIAQDKDKRVTELETALAEANERYAELAAALDDAYQRCPQLVTDDSNAGRNGPRVASTAILAERDALHARCLGLAEQSAERGNKLIEMREKNERLQAALKVAIEVARRYEEAYGGMDDNDSIKWGVVGETRRILGDKVKLGID